MGSTKKLVVLNSLIGNPNILKIWQEFDRDMTRLPPEILSKLLKEHYRRIHNHSEFRPSQNLPIAEETFEDDSKVNWLRVSSSTKISEETFKKLVQEGKPLKWDELCSNRAISGETFDQWVQEGKPVKWSKISKNSMISKEIFLKWIREGRPIDWSGLSKNTRISSEIFDELAEEGKPLNWHNLSGNYNITEEFLRKWAKKGKSLDWDKLSIRSDISEEAFLEWESDCRPLDFLELFNHPDISEETVSRWIKEEKYLTSYHKNSYYEYRNFGEGRLQRYISKNPNLSVKFFQEHIHMIDWSILLKNKFYKQKEIEQEYKKAVKIIEKYYFHPLKYAASLTKN